MNKMNRYCNFKRGGIGQIVDSNSAMGHQDWNIEREVFQLQGKNLPFCFLVFPNVFFQSPFQN